MVNRFYPCVPLYFHKENVAFLTSNELVNINILQKDWSIDFISNDNYEQIVNLHKEKGTQFITL